MEKYVFIFLLFWSLKVIAEKYNLRYNLGTLASKWKSKILYEVSECEFCFEHWLAIIPTLVSFLFFAPEWMDLSTPLLIAGFSNLLKGFRNFD
ncbi:MAG TPA: hypothetical protein VFM82_12225 [Flavobacteriaceae bacterium]|nr:hypothetical protein [Flavobacteriaceae bacterium]